MQESARNKSASVLFGYGRSRGRGEIGMPALEAEGPGWREFTSALKWLEAEGYIETYIGADGSPMVRIAEGAENAKV